MMRSLFYGYRKMTFMKNFEEIVEPPRESDWVYKMEYFELGVHATSHATHKMKTAKKVSSWPFFVLSGDPAGALIFLLIMTKVNSSILPSEA
jgi:hypothetical protein